MSDVFMVAARRSAVVPVNGAFKALSVSELASPVLQQVCADAGLSPNALEHVILGNALYGGGNPARVVALAAGVPEHCPAITIDTQCCSGLDAIALAANMIRLGEADVVLAGGVESSSRRAVRQHRPMQRGAPAVTYERPAFTPWPERDPEMVDSAAVLAHQYHIDAAAQHSWAVHSHAKALVAQPQIERSIVPINGVNFDAATRPLSLAVAQRSRPLSNHAGISVCVAGTALQADAAAFVILVSARGLQRCRAIHNALRWEAALRLGSAADQPPWAVVPTVQRLLQREGWQASDFAVVELMEAFAVQAEVNATVLQLARAQLNPWGGALARGHPIGASGTILAVQAFHQLQQQPKQRALMAIAAAGGLGSAAVLAS